MAIMVGSARIDENGKASGGTAGDQKQTSSTNDTIGEVSMQTMYTHSLGWLIFRPKSVTHANKLAERMTAACNNKHIGYDQNQRDGIIKYGIDTTTDTECDCSSLVRECIIEACGKDPGNIRTVSMPTMLPTTGLFEDSVKYVNQSTTPVYNGDILVTPSSGHTVIVVSGNPRSNTTTSTSTSNSSLTKGARVTLSNTKLYASATTSSASGTKSGTYYVWSATQTNGRIRITTSASYAGISGKVTGWVNVSDITGTTTSTSTTKSSTTTSTATSSKKATASAKSFNKTLAGTYTVNAKSGLYMRNDAGVSATKMVVLPNNTKAQCYGYYTKNSGVNWLYVVATVSGVEYTGFCSSQYLKK